MPSVSLQLGRAAGAALKPVEFLFCCFKPVYLEEGQIFRKVKRISRSIRLKLFLKTLKESFGV